MNGREQFLISLRSLINWFRMMYGRFYSPRITILLSASRDPIFLLYGFVSWHYVISSWHCGSLPSDPLLLSHIILVSPDLHCPAFPLDHTNSDLDTREEGKIKPESHHIIRYLGLFLARKIWNRKVCYSAAGDAVRISSPRLMMFVPCSPTSRAKPLNATCTVGRHYAGTEERAFDQVLGKYFLRPPEV